MGTDEVVRHRIQAWLEEERRTIPWLADETGIEYKKLLRSIRHDRPFSLEEVVELSRATGIQFPALVGEAA